MNSTDPNHPYKRLSLQIQSHPKVLEILSPAQEFQKHRFQPFSWVVVVLVNQPMSVCMLVHSSSPSPWVSEAGSCYGAQVGP